jgi:hypothetical protein
VLQKKTSAVSHKLKTNAERRLRSNAKIPEYGLFIRKIRCCLQFAANLKIFRTVSFDHLFLISSKVIRQIFFAGEETILKTADNYKKNTLWKNFVNAEGYQRSQDGIYRCSQKY